MPLRATRKKPAGNQIDGSEQPMSLDKFAEHLLHHVIHIRFVGHATADEGAQTGTLDSDDVGEAPVLFELRVHSSRPF
jgi:hypothetical protein